MKQLLEKIKSKKILVIGDMVLDHYVWGDANRISPEAPVPVVSVDRDSYVAGMGANVAMNIRSLGAQVEICGPIGKDRDGEQLTDILNGAGVEIQADFLSHTVPTIVKTRVIVRGQQLCRLDRETHPKVYSMEDNGSLDLIEARVADADAVVISDYAKGAVTNALLTRVKQAAHKKKIIVAMDPKPKRPLDYGGVDLLKPNKLESIEMAGLAWNPHDPFPADEVCRIIYEKYGCRDLIVTLGADGMMLSREGKRLKTIPAYAREVFDVSGAGDTSMASLVLALSCGENLEDAAHFANIASGVVVGKVGTAVVTPEEVIHYHPE